MLQRILFLSEIIFVPTGISEEKPFDFSHFVGALTSSLIEAGIPTILGHLLLLGIYGALTYAVKDKKLRTANLISLVIPLYGIVNTANLSYELQIIFDNILCFINVKNQIAIFIHG